MKRLLLLALALSTVSLINAQVYVNAAATGANDGSTWADAYTDLGAALAATTTGDIWVAAGTYNPGTDSTATFNITGDVSLYGGFAGTEASLADRDVSANVTTLSGDNSGDDATNDFTTNRSDNSRHVVTVDSLISGTVRVDGFTVSNGNTTFDPSGMIATTGELSGGGILSFSVIDIAQCTFAQNAGEQGAAFGIVGPPTDGSSVVTNGSTVEDCTFEANFATELGITFFIDTDEIEFRTSTFENNATGRGMVYLGFSESSLFEDLEMTDNVSAVLSAGFRLWQSRGIIIRDSEVSSNEGPVGAALAADFRAFAAEPLGEGNGLLMENCIFDGNSVSAGGFAGAAYIISPNGLKIIDCEVTGNDGLTGPGAMYIDAQDNAAPDTTDMVMENTVFSGNVALSDGGRGGALWTVNALGVFRNCEFTDNEVAGPAGALSISGSPIFRDCLIEDNSAGDGTVGGVGLLGFGVNATFDNCDIRNNSAGDAGAFWLQNAGSILTILNSTVTGNQAVGFDGGAIDALAATTLNIDNSNFSQNSAGEGRIGGAININESNNNNADTLNQLTLNVSNSIFSLNQAAQGGAINIFNASGTLVNNQFANNSALIAADGTFGGGGAISVNIFGDKPDELSFINNTMANNTATIGSNISLFQDSIAVATVNLVNNISVNSNPATQGIGLEAADDGFLTVNSEGGNLIAGDALADVTALFDNPLDAIAPTTIASDIFLNALLGDYQLADMSPAMDIGVITANTPTVDILGVSREENGAPDAGAYESVVINTREEVIDDASQLIVLPNPVQATLYLQMNNDWTGDLSVRIMDLQGRQVRSTQVRKFGDVQTFQVELGNLPAGSYELMVSNGSALLARQIIKQ